HLLQHAEYRGFNGVGRLRPTKNPGRFRRRAQLHSSHFDRYQTVTRLSSKIIICTFQAAFHSARRSTRWDHTRTEDSAGVFARAPSPAAVLVAGSFDRGRAAFSSPQWDAKSAACALLRPLTSPVRRGWVLTAWLPGRAILGG